MRNNSESVEILRQRIKKSPIERLCAEELARLAVDTSYSGFEDPRVAALEALFPLSAQQGRNRSADCAVPDCGASVRVNVTEDIYERSGACEKSRQAETSDHFCLSEHWDNRQSSDDAVREIAVQAFLSVRRVVTEETIGFLCPAIECGFNAGTTLDGGDGSGGVCVKNERGAKNGPSSSEVSVNITQAQQ